MDKPLNNRAWFLVLPVLAIVAFSRRHPADDGGQLLGPGHVREQPVLLERHRLVPRAARRLDRPRQRFRDSALAATCSSRPSSSPSRCRSASSWRSACRASGWTVALCLVLMALPLLIPWNVVGTIWQVFGRGDIGLLGYTINRLGHPLQLRLRPDLGLGDHHRDGRLALDVAGGAALLCRPRVDPRRLLPGGARSTARRAGRCSATSSCRRCGACC